MKTKGREANRRSVTNTHPRWDAPQDLTGSSHMAIYLFTCSAGYLLAFDILLGFEYTHVHVHTPYCTSLGHLSSCQQLGDGSAHCCWVDNMTWMAPPTLLITQGTKHSDLLEVAAQCPKPEVGPTHNRTVKGRPTFSSFQVPDTDGA